MASSVHIPIRPDEQWVSEHQTHRTESYSFSLFDRYCTPLGNPFKILTAQKDAVGTINGVSLSGLWYRLHRSWPLWVQELNPTKLRVVAIDRSVTGEGLRPSSVVLSATNFRIVDDSTGDLYHSATRVGYVNYDLNELVIVHPDFLTIFSEPPVAVDSKIPGSASGSFDAVNPMIIAKSDNWNPSVTANSIFWSGLSAGTYWVQYRQSINGICSDIARLEVIVDPKNCVFDASLTPIASTAQTVTNCLLDWRSYKSCDSGLQPPTLETVGLFNSTDGQEIRCSDTADWFFSYDGGFTFNQLRLGSTVAHVGFGSFRFTGLLRVTLTDQRYAIYRYFIHPITKVVTLELIRAGSLNTGALIQACFAPRYKFSSPAGPIKSILSSSNGDITAVQTDYDEIALLGTKGVLNVTATLDNNQTCTTKINLSNCAEDSVNLISLLSEVENRYYLVAQVSNPLTASYPEWSFSGNVVAINATDSFSLLIEVGAGGGSVSFKTTNFCGDTLTATRSFEGWKTPPATAAPPVYTGNKNTTLSPKTPINPWNPVNGFTLPPKELIAGTTFSGARKPAPELPPISLVDLALSMQTSEQTLGPGEAAQLTILLVNESTISATGVNVVIKLPPGLDYAGNSWPTNLAISGSTLTAVYPSVAGGETKVISFTAINHAPVGPLTVSAYVDKQNETDKDSHPGLPTGEDDEATLVIQSVTQLVHPPTTLKPCAPVIRPFPYTGYACSSDTQFAATGFNRGYITVSAINPYTGTAEGLEYSYGGDVDSLYVKEPKSPLLADGLYTVWVRLASSHDCKSSTSVRIRCAKVEENNWVVIKKVCFIGGEPGSNTDESDCGTTIINYILGGVADGVNKTFTGVPPHKAKSLVLKWNGLEQVINNDYKLINDSVVFTVAPEAGALVRINYKTLI